MRIIKNIIQLLIVICFVQTIFLGQSNELEVITVFKGSWKGTATAFYPRSQDKPNRVESVVVEARKILRENYIECFSIWTQPSGEYRELMTYWNYDARSDKYEVLFLYDNWPGKVNYQLSYDEETKTFTGSDTFTTSEGVSAKEKVEWKVSMDGNTIWGVEYNHFETDPDDYWAKSFEYVWQRKKE